MSDEIESAAERKSRKRLERSLATLVRLTARKKGLVAVPFGEDGFVFLSPHQIAAAEAAGMSRYQAAEAILVARVPRDEFERQVESDNPPTVIELARQVMEKA